MVPGHKSGSACDCGTDLNRRALRAPAWLTATLGGLILVLEGIQQTFQFQDRWIGYRSTWHTLDIERSLYEAGAGPYTDSGSSHQVLADRMVQIVAAEHARWLSIQEQAAHDQQKAKR